MNSQGRKARNDWYYQTNREDINRRRREKRQREKEQRLLESPRLKLVELSGPSRRIAASEHSRTSEHSQTSNPESDDFASSSYPLAECDTTSDRDRAPDLMRLTQDEFHGIVLKLDHFERLNMEFARFESPNLIHIPVLADTSAGVRRSGAKRSTLPLLVAFQLIVTIGLAVLASFLQFEFYREHDVLPGYAWPLAAAGTLGMLSLATVKFESFWADLTRKLLYGACYVFMVMPTSFHVANDA